MNDSKMLKPALIGGILLGVLSSLPLINMFNCFCCAWVIAGGVVAAYQYVKESPIPISLGGGVSVGLFAGIIGTVVMGLFSIPLHLLSTRAGGGILEQLKGTMDQLPNVPPETRQMIESLASRSDMNTAIMLAGMLVTLVIFCIFGMAGGAIGVAIFEKRKPGSAPPEISHYQPPPPPPPPDEEPPPSGL